MTSGVKFWCSLLEEPRTNSFKVQGSRNDGARLDHFSSSILMDSLDFDHSQEVFLIIR